MAAEEALSLLGTLAPDRARLSVDGFSPELDESGRTPRFRTLVSILTQAAQRGIAIPGSPSGLPDSAIERCSESVRAGRMTRPTR